MQGPFVGIYSLKPAFRRRLSAVAHALRRVPPNVISLMAVVFAIAAGILLSQAHERPWAYLAALPLFFLRIAANALDGMVAQAAGTASAKGEIVNELSDRVSDVAIFGGLALNTDVDLRLAVFLIALVLLVSYTGTLAKAVGASRNYAGPFGKADRMALLGLTCLLVYFVPSRVPAWDPPRIWEATFALFIALACVTVFNRVIQTRRELTA